MTPARTREVFAKLAENGANFVRIWTGCQDWALAIESPRSAWGRSWTGKPPIGDLPGHEGKKALRIGGPTGDHVMAAPYDAIPVRPDTEYLLTGQVLFEGEAELRLAVGRSGEDLVVARSGDGGEQGFEHAFRSGTNEYFLHQIALAQTSNGVAWLSDLSLREAAGGPELLADADPGRPGRGVYHPIDSFLLDELVESARDNGVYLQLCVTMRDLYMDALQDPNSREYARAIRDAQSLMRYFVARWGYSTSVAAWEYFNEMDPGRPTDRFYAELGEYLDRIDPYGHPQTTSTWSVSHQDWRHPQLDIAEAHHYLRPSTLEKTPDVVAAVLDQARDLREHALNRPMLLAEFGLADEKWGLSSRMKEDQRLEHFHNALWASSLSGLSGTAMFWWWEQLDHGDAYHHYRPLADYLKTVPFVSARLEPDQAEVTGSQKIVVVGLKGTGCGYYWLYDSESSWERRGRSAESKVTSARLHVTGLAPGDYTVQWWDTWTGAIVDSQTVVSSNDDLALAVPTFAHDIACQITGHKML